MNDQMNIQNINIHGKQVLSYQRNIHILVNIFTITKRVTDITEHIDIYKYTSYVIWRTGKESKGGLGTDSKTNTINIRTIGPVLVHYDPCLAYLRHQDLCLLVMNSINTRSTTLASLSTKG